MLSLKPERNMSMQESLALFHPIIQKWFIEKIGTPTDIQKKAWVEIADNNHVLITAPTGSGKTLAALLWAINQLAVKKWSSGQLKVLYISPLKALNNDVQRNLLKPLTEIKEYFNKEGKEFPVIRVLTRSGDTPNNERYKILHNPPEILITTPESLNIILTSANSRRILSGIETVILDEIHAIIGNKRGTHLITAIDRIVPLYSEFQRIALSATIRPIDKTAEFVGGYKMIGSFPDCIYEKRNVSIVKSTEKKQFQVKINFPQNAHEEIVDGTWWPSLIKEFKKIISSNKSTLLFSNSRRMTEKVTHLINEFEPEEIAYSHHSSLSKEFRLKVEQKLKNGELKAIVATNSLELGIDIGDLDQVILIQTPFSISSGIQRIGRAGHSVGEISKGVIFPTHGRDFLNSAIIAKAILLQDIEEIYPIESPLDILAQIILSMTCAETWDIDKLYAFLKTTYPYRNLQKKHYNLTLDMLAGKYADTRIRELNPRISIDRLSNTINAKQNSAVLIYLSGGTISDSGYFDLKLADTHAKIGELDEEFVWERRLGETFALGTQLWRIEKITHNDVEVTPAKNTLNIIPFWRAEEQNRDFHFSEKISVFLEMINSKICDDNIKQELMQNYFMDEYSALELIHFLRYQKEITNSDLPHRHNILIEHFDDPLNKADKKQVIIHTLWGGRINHPFALALSGAWQKKYKYPLEVIANNDAIMLMLPHEFSTQSILTLVTPDNLENLLRAKLEESGFFGARFRENAGTALLLPKANFRKRIPLWLNRLRSKKLLEAVLSYEDFPILLETWRTCLDDEFDIDNLKILLDEIHEGKITINEAITHTASPFADNLIWKQTNKFMYEDDTPDYSKISGLKDDLIKEFIFSSHLRPKIPEELIHILDKKLKRIAPDYAPSTPQDLLDWIKERLLIPSDEWNELLKACERDYELNPEQIYSELKEKIIWINLPDTTEKFICSIEIVKQLIDVFKIKQENFKFSPVLDNDNSLKKKVQNLIWKYQKYPLVETQNFASLQKEDLEDQNSCLMDFINQWLFYYCPIEKIELNKIFGIREEILNEILESLIRENRIIVDLISEKAKTLEICNISNLEILLRMARKQRQAQFNPLPSEKLTLFLAVFHGMANQGERAEHLEQCFDQLFGYPLQVSAWEEFILPARLKSYYPNWLDNLVHAGSLIWFGCGNKKISFAFHEDLCLFFSAFEKESKEDLNKLFPNKFGKYSFFDITNFSKQDTAKTAEELWTLAWHGKISNDSFVIIRKGILNKFIPETLDKNKISRRTGLKRWEATRPISGNWFILAKENEEPDLIEQAELIKDRIRQLLRRYGILFRNMVENELPLLQWKNIFRTLRLMELSGEILSGYFFEGISGLQFISHDAFRMLQQNLPENAIYWINATDPISLCGINIEKIKSTLPKRISSNYIVYNGSNPVMIIKQNGKELQINTDSDALYFQQYLTIFKTLLTRDFNPLKRIIIEVINNEPAYKSKYAEQFLKFGFKSTYKGLEIWRSEALS